MYWVTQEFRITQDHRLTGEPRRLDRQSRGTDEELSSKTLRKLELWIELKTLSHSLFVLLTHQVLHAKHTLR